MALSKWAVDSAHSSIDFSVKHMVFATVKGSFGQFEATVEADPTDLTTATIAFAVDVTSVDTRNADRDNHLRTGDFFDVEAHPKMTFTSTNITKTGEHAYNLTGDLTIRGVTHSTTFAATFDGQGKDPWGNVKVGFTAEGKINRSEFGLTYNAVLETGGVLVGDQISISVHIEAAAIA